MTSYNRYHVQTPQKKVKHILYGKPLSTYDHEVIRTVARKRKGRQEVLERVRKQRHRKNEK